MIIFFRYSIFIVALLFLMSLSSVPSRADEAMNAEEIIAKMNAAMKQPLRYTRIVDGNEYLTYRKTLSDGSEASLVEDMPTDPDEVKSVSMRYENKRYRVYLDAGIAIDMAFRSKAAKELQEKIISKIPSESSQYETEYAPVQTLVYEGKECYQIDDITYKNKRVAENNLVDRSVVSKDRYIIEKNTFYKLMEETIESDGETVFSTQYKDITLQPDLTDDFFQLPPNLDLKTPQTEQDYDKIIEDLILPQTKRVERRNYVPPPPRDFSKYTWSKQSELTTAPLESTTIDSNLDQSLASEIKQPDTHTRYIVLLLVNAVVFAIIIVFVILYRRHVKRK